MMKFLASKKMSLACTIINCGLATMAMIAGDATWFLISTGLAALCFWNYQNTQ